jgi:type IV pilus assembly protein PilC
MPSFLYKARDQEGVLQSGPIDATDEEEALAILQHRGLVVTSVTHKELEGERLAERRMARLHGRVTAEDKILLCQQLVVLLEAGLPLLRSLGVLCAQVASRPLLAALEQVRQDLGGGLTFHQALARHPKIFSSLWINLVESGESSGHLALALKQLARFLESARTLRSKAMTALTYPMVLIGAALIAMAVFMLKIIPVFSGMFASMNVPLPFITQAILTASDLARRYALLIALGAGAAWYLAQRFLHTEQGKALFDRLLLALPVLKGLFSSLQLAQFGRGLSTLLDSGLPILSCLEIMERTLSNAVYARAMGQVKEAIREGKPMALPLEQAGVFPPMAVQMVQVGEEIGELSKMLERVATYYEERTETFIARLTVLFEPIAIAVMAVIIGTLVIAMFLPIFSLAGSGGLGR